MNQDRWWVALVTFERRDEEQDTLPISAQGAVGWMAALAPDVETACKLLVRDVEYLGLRVLEIDNKREVFAQEEIEEIDNHLAANFRNVDPGKQTIWGTIHCYKGDGEA